MIARTVKRNLSGVLLIGFIALLVVGSSAAVVEAKQYVPILDKEMSRKEIVKRMKQEGSITIANWTYGGMASEYFGPGFERYIQEKYGVDITAHWLGTQSPGTYMTQVFASLKANTNVPYDVVAIETPHFFTARSRGIAQKFIVDGGNPLIPIYPKLSDFFKQYAPHGILFQALNTGGMIVNTEKAPFVEDYADLADPRLKGHILVPTIGSVHFTNFLLNLSLALDKDYKDPEDMEDVIAFAAEKIHPNVLKYSSSESTMIQLLERGVIWAESWWFYLGNVEQMKGYPITWKPQPQGNVMQPGVAWIPKNASHPVLAQAFMNYLVSPERTLAQYWPQLRDESNKSDFMMVHQMLPSEDFHDELPDWIKDDYGKYMPWPMEKIQQWNTFVDWNYVIEHSDAWARKYRNRIS